MLRKKQGVVYSNDVVIKVIVLRLFKGRLSYWKVNPSWAQKVDVFTKTKVLQGRQIVLKEVRSFLIEDKLSLNL